MNHVYSTLSSDMIYTTWASKAVEGANMNQVEKQVHIAGGMGVATKHLITPDGIKTEVSDEDLEHLERNHTFQLHKKNGFIKVLKRKVEVEKAVVDMNNKDESRPMTETRLKEQRGIDKNIKPASNQAA